MTFDGEYSYVSITLKYIAIFFEPGNLCITFFLDFSPQLNQRAESEKLSKNGVMQRLPRQ